MVLLVLMLISSVVYYSINQMIDANKWVNHTYEVIRTAQSVTGAMVDMETGQRGFMITGEEEYLDPFNMGQAQFYRLIEHGQQLTSDNPNQGVRWAKIVELKERWMAEAALPEIAARREVAKGEAATWYFNQVSSRTVGKEIFDGIRATIADLETRLAGNRSGRETMLKITLDLVNMGNWPEGVSPNRVRTLPRALPPRSGSLAGALS